MWMNSCIGNNYHALFKLQKRTACLVNFLVTSPNAFQIHVNVIITTTAWMERTRLIVITLPSVSVCFCL